MSAAPDERRNPADDPAIIRQRLTFAKKDVNFEQHRILVREPIEMYNLVTLLSVTPELSLQAQLQAMNHLHERNLASGHGEVPFPMPWRRSPLLAAAMGISEVAHEYFCYPNTAKDWHVQAIALVQEIETTPSKRIAAFIQLNCWRSIDVLHKYLVSEKIT